MLIYRIPIYNNITTSSNIINNVYIIIYIQLSRNSFTTSINHVNNNETSASKIVPKIVDFSGVTSDVKINSFDRKTGNAKSNEFSRAFNNGDIRFNIVTPGGGAGWTPTREVIQSLILQLLLEMIIMLFLIVIILLF